MEIKQEITLLGKILPVTNHLMMIGPNSGKENENLSRPVWFGRLINFLAKDTHIIISGPCDFILHCKRGFLM